METDWKAEADRLIEERLVADTTRPDLRMRPEMVLFAACVLHGVTVSDVCGRGRTKPLVAARETYVGAASELTAASLPEIAEAVCRRSHSTVWNSRYRWRLRSPEQRAADIAEVRSIALGRHGRTQ